MQIGEVASFQNGYAFKSKDFVQDGKYKTIKIKELKNGKVRFFNDSVSVNVDDERIIEKYIVEKGDVLFALTGDPVNKNNPLSWVGRVSIYEDDQLALLNQRVCKLVPNEELNAKYIYYYFRAFNNFYALASIAKGSASQANISTKDIEAMEIDLPSLIIQNKIVSVLDSIEEKINQNNKINKNLEQQAQAILTSFFIDFSQFGGTVPDDWKQGTLQDIANFSNGYAFKSKELLNTSEPNCYQVFKQGHINRGGGFNSSGTKSWYPISKSSALSKYVLHKGDVLMAMTDMKDNVAILGNTALMAVDDQYIVNQRVGLLRSNGYKSTSYAYIYLLTNSLNFLKDLRSRANSGVQVNLSSSEIKDSSVWIANDEVNEEFNALTEPLLSMIMTNDIENQKLINLRDTLLPKLMSGELDVSNINL